MQSITQKTTKQHYKSPQLPLAVYREVAAHVRQVTGVDAGLIVKPLKDGKEAFDYYASQIESLWIEHSEDLPAASQQKIAAILEFYGKRYQPWENIKH